MSTTARAPLTLIDAILPDHSRRIRVARDAGLVLAGSALIAMLAQITIPTLPVPVTGQTLGVMLVGAALGARRGALAAAAYLLEGLCGLPVFAGFTGTALVLAGPTGGYLLGFIPAAYITGMLAQRGWDRRFPGACMAMLLGNVAVFACGVTWLAAVVGWGAAVKSGLLPFVPLDAGVKVLLGAALLPLAWRVFGRGR